MPVGWLLESKNTRRVARQPVTQETAGSSMSAPTRTVERLELLFQKPLEDFQDSRLLVRRMVFNELLEQLSSFKAP
jgi:hypothetical protein